MKEPSSPVDSGNQQQVFQRALSIGLGLLFALLAIVRVQSAIRTETCDFVEISFAVQNLVLIIMLVGRHQHVMVDGNLLHQGIALVAVFSGLGFIDLPAVGPSWMRAPSKIIVFSANVLGIWTLVSLNKSFAFLIALREVKTSGLYAVVRHPMYATDILLRIGYILGNFNSQNLFLFIFSTFCYVFRAILEERFLIQHPDYREYMGRVTFRFIPYIF